MKMLSVTTTGCPGDGKPPRWTASLCRNAPCARKCCSLLTSGSPVMSICTCTSTLLQSSHMSVTKASQKAPPLCSPSRHSSQRWSFPLRRATWAPMPMARTTQDPSNSCLYHASLFSASLRASSRSCSGRASGLFPRAHSRDTEALTLAQPTSTRVAKPLRKAWASHCSTASTDAKRRSKLKCRYGGSRSTVLSITTRGWVSLF
mmetsp:Transcript_45023/g.113985  ORF Transcript_45023/g.113985 Transcript_45023/m.113985 type:complete len:204 (-) Transcript_45023:179-790(-)